MTAALAKSYRFGRFVVDARSACLRRDGAPVPLRPKSFDVLLHLVKHRGRLMSKDELFDTIWGDVTVTDNSLVQCIKEIRQALGDDRQTLIETVAKRGYVFTPAVVEIDDGDPSLTAVAETGEPATRPARVPTPHRDRGRRARAGDRGCGRIVVDLESADGAAIRLPTFRRPTATPRAARPSRSSPSASRERAPTTISRSASARTSPRRSAGSPILRSHRRASSRDSAASEPAPTTCSAS